MIFFIKAKFTEPVHPVIVNEALEKHHCKSANFISTFGNQRLYLSVGHKGDEEHLTDEVIKSLPRLKINHEPFADNLQKV